jgi:hypothetical protein
VVIWGVTAWIAAGSGFPAAASEARVVSTAAEHEMATAQHPTWWVSGFGLRALGFELRASGFRLRVSGLGFRASGFRLQASGFGLRVSGFGFRLSAFGFHLGREGAEELDGARLVLLV